MLREVGPPWLGSPWPGPRWPWWGPDLQTLRDTLWPLRLPEEGAATVRFPLDPIPSAPGAAPLQQPQALVGLSVAPAPATATPPALVVLLHGLGGSSEARGVRRLGQTLAGAGFGVLRLNLRGAGPGRPLAAGTYAAACNRDLLPVLHQIAALAAPAPLLGVGLSLGGTVLLNAALAEPGLLAGLVCVSSPLDLAACSDQIGRPRNRLYQRWLLRRLIALTQDDPFGLDPAEQARLQGPGAPGSIRAFDAAITAPRWGYPSVEAYYRDASPLQRLLAGAPLPPTLLVHALDDPWVPATATQQLAAAAPAALCADVVLTAGGGHNGFHARGDGPSATWADQLTLRWLQRQLS
ncbi:alpha/beta fold hydrolase [Cyanobium sp. NS01]|uniref:alpha/beta fold hydrolase n=1 Tax=Cyanobium sp. NS01 TaxID=261284 RepID=UPI0016481916|nr:alpha/beta fold hydrolase [Cyanobium sp. NS01]QNI70004.1 alpha/beta hydrolase [Cyanobium sp. NS01]